jgi:hypothetical protein
MAVVSAMIGPKVRPMKVMNDPVEGIDLENSASVLPSSATAMAATTMVSGEAIPAVVASRAKPKKKLMAGPMLAMVEAVMSARLRAPRWSRSGCRRSADSPDVVAEDIALPPPGRPVRSPRSPRWWRG